MKNCKNDKVKNVGLEQDVNEHIAQILTKTGQTKRKAVNIALRRAVKIGASFFLPE